MSFGQYSLQITISRLTWDIYICEKCCLFAFTDYHTVTVKKIIFFCNGYFCGVVYNLCQQHDVSYCNKAKAFCATFASTSGVYAWEHESIQNYCHICVLIDGDDLIQ